ncbi:MAG: ferredoxin [Candidatus Aenigmarchaeota archaeon]|nr:ferredoxin [Candidatus Aenigmarchaeota archaeon]
MGLGLFKKKEEKIQSESKFMTGWMERDEPQRNANPHLYRIVYSRKHCIGGDICTFVDPVHFNLSKKDGKADFLNSQKQEDGTFVMTVEDPTMNDIGNPLRRAADSCPAGVIRVVRVKDGRLVAGH